MKTIFSDPTPKWVPFVAVVMIAGGAWIGSIWQNFDFEVSTQVCFGIFLVLFVAIFFQGRYYWKDQVDRLGRMNDSYEAVTMRWVGRGKTVKFAAKDATGFTAKARGTTKEGAPAEPSAIDFKVRGKPLSLSLVNPRIVDLAELDALAPEFMKRFRADYPNFKSAAE